MLFGLGIDILYQWLGVSPRAIIGNASELIPAQVKLVAVVILLAISIKPLARAIRQKFVAKPDQTTFISPFPPVPSSGQHKVNPPGKEAADHCSCCK